MKDLHIGQIVVSAFKKGYFKIADIDDHEVVMERILNSRLKRMKGRYAVCRSQSSILTPMTKDEIIEKIDNDIFRMTKAKETIHYLE